MIFNMKRFCWWGRMGEANAWKCLETILREHQINISKAKSGKGGGYEKSWLEKVNVDFFFFFPIIGVTSNIHYSNFAEIEG